MLRRCLSCHRPFAPNDVLEQLPHGRSVAFDPWRGRLWLICGSCARWSLVPFEARWEALEQLERLASGGARLLRQGDHIALLRSGPLELVRVGRADAREEAWWRYGSEFAARRRRAHGLARTGKVLDGLLMLALTGIPYWGHSDAEGWIGRARRRTFGRDAWRGDSVCARCGHRLGAISFEEREHLHLAWREDSLALWYGCPRCRGSERDTGHLLGGVAAEHVLRRVLAYRNFAGGTAANVASAQRLVAAHSSARALLQESAGSFTSLGPLADVPALAAEIALNDSLEAALLQGEVRALELRWREEELLAAIIDGELTPPVGADGAPPR